MPLRTVILLLVLAAVSVGGSASGHAQVPVRVIGAELHPAARALDEVVRRGALVLTRDTILPETFRHEGDLVVIRADVRTAGTVTGAVAVVEGDFFLRPGGSVGGVIEVNGAAHLSGLAGTGTRVSLDPRYTTSVEFREEEILVTILGPPPLPRFRLTGFRGVQGLAYDRVNGLTAAYGARLRLGAAEPGGFLAGNVQYYTARRAFGGALTTGFALGDNLTITATAASTPATADYWIRGPLANSLAAIALRSDARDYHHSDRVALSLFRPLTAPLIQGEASIRPRATVLASRDRSLVSAEPWSLLGRGEPWRANPPIDEGTLVSLTGGTAAEWIGAGSRFSGEADLEWSPAGLGDFEFTHLVVEGELVTRALLNHSLQMYARGTTTLTDRQAPLQRWSFVGGAGTLPTLEEGAMRGDRLVFVETIYRVPLNVAIRFAGVPRLRIQHAIGAAWPTGTEPPAWEQNVGGGIEVRIFHASVLLDPADPSPRPSWSFGTTFRRGVGRGGF